MNCILVVISSVMSEEATFLVESQKTNWATVDPTVMKSFLMKVQVLAGGSSVVTDITAVPCLKLFLLQGDHHRSWLGFTSHSFSNHYDTLLDLRGLKKTKLFI